MLTSKCVYKLASLTFRPVLFKCAHKQVCVHCQGMGLIQSVAVAVCCLVCVHERNIQRFILRVIIYTFDHPYHLHINNPCDYYSSLSFCHSTSSLSPFLLSLSFPPSLSFPLSLLSSSLSFPPSLSFPLSLSLLPSLSFLPSLSCLLSHFVSISLSFPLFLRLGLL